MTLISASEDEVMCDEHHKVVQNMKTEKCEKECREIVIQKNGTLISAIFTKSLTCLLTTVKNVRPIKYL